MSDFFLSIPWWVYCVYLMVGTASYGILMRFVDADIHPSLMGAVFNAIACLFLLVFLFIYIASGGTPEWTYPALALSVVIGAGFVGVDRGVMGMYKAGMPVSLGMPIIRIAVAVCTAIAGFVFFAEALTLTRLAGIVVGCIGIYLALQKKEG